VTLDLKYLHLDFPHGIPAFETHKQFRLIEREPLLFLESETAPDLSFLLLPVRVIDPEYRMAISVEDQETLVAGPESRLLCLAVITTAEDSPPTANLLAPVVVNLDNGRAVQAVRSDSLYSHKKAICW
jgi:flagellar assembly factor FliW